MDSRILRPWLTSSMKNCVHVSGNSRSSMAMGKVSHEAAWHSAAMTCEDGLTISHFPDPAFDTEDANLMQVPAAGRYNNVSLISDNSFHPLPSGDVVLKFSTLASENFYGTAGVIFQPVGTLQEDGRFMKPFDMFGFSIAGRNPP